MSDDSSFRRFLEGYCENVVHGFESRWTQVKPDIFERHTHESVGGLLSRQATLSIELAQSPACWNGHSAPLVLRCQTDAYITLAWILGDLRERAKQYILYGLGQEKLYIEYLKEALQDDPDGYDAERIEELIRLRAEWLEGQIAEWAAEVNVGSWSGKSVREMAIEAGVESIYRYAYVPFSGPAHNMWQHVGIYNMTPCRNPMHKWHLVPEIREPEPHPDFMYRSAKYVSQSYELFDEKMDTTSDVPLPVDFFLESSLPESEDEDNSTKSDT